MAAADEIAPGEILYVLASLPGDGSPGEGATSSTVVARDLESQLGAPVIEAVAGGGFFLDQETLAEEKLSEDAILAAMDKMRAANGDELFADRFSGVAVTFARYC